MYPFISYQTADKAVAGMVKQVLGGMGISAFLAHEDIEVSLEWRTAILTEIEKTDIFIPLLSTSFYQSLWCQHESGIAAFRNMTIIPLSIDGSIPQGFLSLYQSMRISPTKLDRRDLLPGLAKHDVSMLIDKLTQILRHSGNYRQAEADFDLVHPYISKATDAQIVQILRVSNANDQVSDAGKCAVHFLPPLLKSHGHLMPAAERQALADTLKKYTAPPPLN